MEEAYKAELGALRSELNQNITSMASNETFCAGACAALISFAFTKQSGLLVSVSSISLALLIYLFGLARFKVMSRHTALLDKYMYDRESCQVTTGWATWYSKNEPNTFPTYNQTRDAFWQVLLIVIVSSFFIVIGVSLR